MAHTGASVRGRRSGGERRGISVGVQSHSCFHVAPLTVDPVKVKMLGLGSGRREAR